MTGPTSELLSYQLSPDASQGFSWGTTPPFNTLPGTGNGAVQVVTVFGVILPDQFVGPGTYSDTIIATLTF
jgi:spore coat protein U-like protein